MEKLPEEIVCLVFCNLDIASLGRVSQVCKKWHRIADDAFLWKRHFLAKWKVSNPPAGNNDNWRDGLKRLTAKVPLVESGANFFHSDEVLHVTFSKNGDLFATCSKDRCVVVWNFEPDSVGFSSIKHVIRSRGMPWGFPFYSVFNDCADLLMVSGYLLNHPDGKTVIAVFRIDTPDHVLQSLTTSSSINCSWIAHSEYFKFASLSTERSLVYRSHSPATLNKDVKAFYVGGGKWYSMLLATDLGGQNWFIYAAPGNYGGRYLHMVCFKRIPAKKVSPEFTAPDYCVDLEASIVGMTLSPDDRVLFVNSHPWLQKKPDDRMTVSEEMQIRAFDLATFNELPTSPLTGHRGLIVGHGCALIYLDACDEFVATGSGDGFAYIFDRRYGICAAKLQHENVVNSVAFHPRNSEIILTASDDHTVKFWMSRAQAAEKKKMCER